MAVAFGTAGTGTTASVASLTITKPASLAAGDLMIAECCAHANGVTFSAPATGWTKVGDFSPTGQTVVTHSIFWKIADSGDAAGSNFVFTSGGSSRGLGAITRWTGHDPTTPIQDTLSNPAAGSSTATQVAKSINGTNGGALVAHYSEGHGGGSTWTAFSGSTGKPVDFNSGGTTSSHQASSVQYLLLSSTGTTGDKTSTSSQAAFYAAWSVTIQPPAVVGIPDIVMAPPRGGGGR